MDGFWCTRCLNDRIKVSHMMRLFASGATTPLVVKMKLKKKLSDFFSNILFMSIKSEIMDEIWCSRCQNNHINLPEKIGSFLSGNTASLVAKNRKEKIVPLLWIKVLPVDRFWCFRWLNDYLYTTISTGINWVGLVWHMYLWQPC